MAFDPPASSSPNLGLGTNDLQGAIDRNTSAVNSLATELKGQQMPGGMRKSAPFAQGAEGQTFSFGSFPSVTKAKFTEASAASPVAAAPHTASSMSSSASSPWVQAAFRMSSPGTPSTPSVPETPTPSTVATPPGQPPAVTQARFVGGSGGSGGPTTAAPASAPPAPPGGGGTVPPGTPVPPTGGGGGGFGGGNGNGGFSSASAVVGGITGAARGIVASGVQSMPNMLLYNAYGTQMQNQYGMSAQSAQNTTFGSGALTSVINGMSPQDMAQGMSTLTQMSSGNWGTSQFQQGLAATNMATLANQGMSATQGAQFASDVYNPMTSLRGMMLGLPTPLQMGSGRAMPMGQFTQQLLPRLGLVRTGPNGSFNKQQMSALSNPMSAQNLDMQASGWSQQDIQTFAATAQTENNAQGSKYAQQHHIGANRISQLMQQAENGKHPDQEKYARGQLSKMNVNQSTLQHIQNLNKQQTANQQAESGGYNSTLQKGVDALTDIDQQFGELLTNVKWIASALGAAKGAGATASMAHGMASNSLGGQIANGMGLGGGIGIGAGLLKGGLKLGSKFIGGGGAAGAGEAATGAEAAGGMGLLSTLGIPLGAAAAEVGASWLAGKGGHALHDAAHLPSWLNSQGKKGVGNWASKAGNIALSGLDAIPGVAPTTHFIQAMFGGGAGSVSTTQPQTKQGSKPGSSTSSVPKSVSTAVQDAEHQVGKPYVYGGASPATSFDCSGLVMWAYEQAGVKLPRTSQAQWAALKGKSVPLNKVQEGDIIFTAGSDGTASAPGHEAMMISNKQIVEAPHTGANIRIRGYNPGEWQHAARPVNWSGKGATGNVPASVSKTNNGPVPASALSSGNTGAGVAGNGGDQNLGIVSNADDMLFGAGAAAGAGIASMGQQAAQQNSAANGGNKSSNATTTGNYPNKSGGKIPQNAGAIANFLAGKGANKIAIAGILGNIEQESGGNPNAGSNPPGKGLIQILGDPGGSLQADLQRTWQYIQQNGGIGPVNKARNATQAATIFCNQYERPGIPALSNRISAANASFAAGYEQGGHIDIVGERGPEAMVRNGASADVYTAKQTASLLSGTTAKPAQAPWKVSPSEQLLLDSSPANRGNPGAASRGVSITLGDIHIGGSPGVNQFSGTLNPGSDIMTVKQQFQDAVKDAFNQSELLDAIRSGDTGS